MWAMKHPIYIAEDLAHLTGTDMQTPGHSLVCMHTEFRDTGLSGGTRITLLITS